MALVCGQQLRMVSSFILLIFHSGRSHGYLRTLEQDSSDLSTQDVPECRTVYF